MYLSFYGLREKPFDVTPDPRFLYLSPGHREALAQLVYGVSERKGFIVLTGRVGTGKTTLLQALRQRLNGHTAMTFVVNPSVSFDGILECVLDDLGVTKVAESRRQRLSALNNALIERERSGQNTVLVIDEAQTLDAATLEQIRLLSNFELPSKKLLQIVLAGQPELHKTLRLPELQQLRQRIALHGQIAPLTRAEVRDYMRTRLRIAGARDLGIFTDGAIDRIADYSGGVPRLISILADHALVFAYADQKRRVERRDVSQAVDYLEESTSLDRGRRGFQRAAAPRRLRWLIATLGLAAAGVVVTMAAHVDATLLGLVRSVRALLTP